MSQNDAKAAMKQLRESRKDFIRAAGDRMKAQKKVIQALTRQLENGAQTVPQLAAAIGAGTAETLWYVAALKKYGQVVEAKKEGAYFSYALNAKPGDDLPD